MGEAAKANEAIKKAGETLGKAADSVSGSVSGAAESIGKSGAFKASYLKTRGQGELRFSRFFILWEIAYENMLYLRF